MIRILLNRVMMRPHGQEVLAGILKHVNTQGWEQCCWSDDNLSTKKLYPGFQFAGKQQWVPRLRRWFSSFFDIWLTPGP